MASAAGKYVHRDHRQFQAEIYAAVREVCKRWDTGVSEHKETADLVPGGVTKCNVTFGVTLTPKLEKTGVDCFWTSELTTMKS